MYVRISESKFLQGMGELVTHLLELVTRRLIKTCFHWENKAVSSNSYGQCAV
jgi:hypothetical protein